MEKSKIGLPLSIVIATLVILVLGILTWISARQIYMKLVVYHYPAAVKPWMWANVLVVGISLIAVILICLLQRFQLTSPAAWWIVGIFVLNIVLRILVEFIFFGGSKGQWVG